MSDCDFKDIPPLGDSVVVGDDEVEQDVVVESEQPLKKYRFNGRYLYVTWSKSTIESKEEFETKLLPLLPAKTQVFGGRELHKDGTPHYHAVFKFENKVHWTDAHKHLTIQGDTTAIHIAKPRPRQRVDEFLETTQAYCSKDGDTFGERMSLEGAASERKKRAWQEAVDEPDAESAWRMIRQLEPRACFVSFPAIEAAMNATKKRRVVVEDRPRPKGRFRVPKIMDLWMQRYVVKREWTGRPKSLVIVGDPMVGKSAFAESQGRPIVMNSGWCLKSIFPGATHIVVSDVRPAAFGYQGKSHWRDVLGGQERFNCRDFQQETRTVEWGLPCIWTCNFDNDPRKDPGVAAYIARVSVVVEVRDRPGESGWGKLYLEEDGEGVAEDPEWAEALEEANGLRDLGYVDEAVGLSNDEFGI